MIETKIVATTGERRVSLLSGLWDVRANERRLVVLAFAILLLLVGAHTMLETARDTLLLSKMNPRRLGVVYLIVAVVAWPTGLAAARLNARVGNKKGFIATLLASSAAVGWLCISESTDRTAILLYVTSALIGSILVSQFWSLITSVLTVAQARRLVSPVSAAGVIGGVVGASAAALVASTTHTRPILAIAALSFAGCAVLAGFMGDDTHAVKNDKTEIASGVSTMRRDPYLLRVAGLAVLSTVGVLTVDYLFKWSVAQSVPRESLGIFLARYYAVINVLSLFVQLFVGAALVQRLGVTGALSVTPLLLLGGGLLSLVLGGSLLAVLVAKGVDGSLRYSIHRTTTELLYMPVPAAVRARLKPIIDGPIVRLAQALVALVFLAMGNMLSGRMLGGAVVLATTGWLALAGSMRKPYLRVFRESLSAAGGDVAATPLGNLDMETAELLIEHLSSTDSSQVQRAMNLLSRSGRARLIPALVLLHPDEEVLVSALKILEASSRTDWYRLAERLLEDPREPVRLASMRALARHRQAEKLSSLGGDLGDRARGYALFHMMMRDAEGYHSDDPRIVAMLIEEDRSGQEARRGFIAALADAPPSEAATELLRSTAEQGKLDVGVEFTELLAQAAARHEANFLIPVLVERLELRAGRDALRSALVQFGDAALDVLWSTLQDPATPRRLRVHIPRTLARFGTERSAELLLTDVETEKDGLVRYKSLRGLGRILNDTDVHIDRKRVERLCKKNLIELLHLIALRAAFDEDAQPAASSSADGSDAIATRRLLTGLLDDKVTQCLERAFRLLKALFPREDIHRVHWAARSSETRARANAGEFLDALLARRDHEELRQLFRLITDDFSTRERIRRAEEWMRSPARRECAVDTSDVLVVPKNASEALALLVQEHDVMLAALAVAYATALGNASSMAALSKLEAARPNVRRQTLRLFSPPRANAGSAAPAATPIGAEIAAERLSQRTLALATEQTSEE